MRALAAAIGFTIAIALPTPAAAGWTAGEFQSAGKPVQENHCVPSGEGPFPAVILLHGASPRGAGNRDFEDLCSKLADHGYYAEYVEYYSQTEEASAADVAGIVRNFPTWLEEVHAGVAALKKNPSIGSGKIGLMGFSLGAFISLTDGATYPDDAAAIVEYYGGLEPSLNSRAATMPPVLIIHGSIDHIVPVSRATDLDAILTKAGRAHEMKLYPGAEHAFNFPEAMFWYKPADANDALNRSIGFLDKYLKSDSK